MFHGVKRNLRRFLLVKTSGKAKDVFAASHTREKKGDTFSEERFLNRAEVLMFFTSEMLTFKHLLQHLDFTTFVSLVRITVGISQLAVPLHLSRVQRVGQLWTSLFSVVGPHTNKCHLDCAMQLENVYFWPLKWLFVSNFSSEDAVISAKVLQLF